MYILYGGGVSRGLGPQMVLEEAGLAYELKTVDMAAGDHRQAEFLALNPAGYVPALLTPEGVVLHEAGAIMLALADRHGLTDMAPAPDDPLRGPFLSRLFFICNDIIPPTKRLFYPHRYAETPEDRAKVRENARTQALDRWAVAEGWLAEDGPFLLGARLSLADLYLALWARYGLATTDEILEGFPAVRRCYEAVSARPKCGALLKPLEAPMRAWRGELKRSKI